MSSQWKDPYKETQPKFFGNLGADPFGHISPMKITKKYYDFRICQLQLQNQLYRSSKQGLWDGEGGCIPLILFPITMHMTVMNWIHYW